MKTNSKYCFTCGCYFAEHAYRKHENVCYERRIATLRAQSASANVDSSMADASGYIDDDILSFAGYDDDTVMPDTTVDDPTSDDDSVYPKIEGDTIDEGQPKVYNYATEADPLSMAEELSLELFMLTKSLGVSRDGHDMISKFVNKALQMATTQSPSVKVLSHYKSKDLLTRQWPTSFKRFDMCPRGCVVFHDSEQVNCPNHSCDGKRYKDPTAQIKIPSMSIKILSLSDMLASKKPNDVSPPP
ncbi:hypothetical protein [Absidia glauca]|uniref:Uncharacterized protein n=1 Tax=Absidia glauca TaxID=4829 RepID=A0A163MLZ0_ABSGL|nr:hypothetical protein [Absidia glauca]